MILQNYLSINVANDNELLVTEYGGEIEGRTDHGQEIVNRNVLYFPELRDNVLSVHILTMDGLKVEYKKDKAEILRNGISVW